MHSQGPCLRRCDDLYVTPMGKNRMAARAFSPLARREARLGMGPHMEIQAMVLCVTGAP